MNVRRHSSVAAMAGGVVVGVAVTALVSSNLAVGGPLDPPAGPIQDTSPSLADIQSSLGSATGGEVLDGPEFLDTSMVPGSARDGKPLPLAGNSDMFIDVEIEGVATLTEFAVIDIAQSIELEEFLDGGEFVILAPGVPRNKISLIRTLPAQDTALLQWYQDHDRAGGQPKRDVVIRLRNQNATEVASYNCLRCLISGLDVRSIDG